MAAGDISDMPIQAFQKARLGIHPLALVPTIYALRADEISRFAICPSDGAVAVPSYICARRSVSEKTARAVVAELTSPEICAFYVRNGDLICCVGGSDRQMWMSENGYGLQAPDEQWLLETAPEDFYDFYCGRIAGARRE